MNTKVVRVNGTTFREATWSELQVDEEYQRTLDEKRAQWIADKWDDSRLGFVVVSERADKTLWIIDGQHRWRAAILSGRGTKRVYVDVRTGLSRQDEAALFVLLNGRDSDGARCRRDIRAHDEFIARTVARDPVASEVMDIVKSIGLSVARVPTEGNVSAVSTMESVHRNAGNLSDTMSVLSKWSSISGWSKKAFDGRLIKHVSEFLAEFPRAQPLVLAKKLASNGTPADLITLIRSDRRAYNGRISTDVCARNRLLSIYNRKNRNPLYPDDSTAFA